MNSSIGHLHYHYRVANKATFARHTSRLEHLAKSRLPEVYGEMLGQVLGNDPKVYIVRQVKFKIPLLLSDQVTDEQLVKRWGKRMTSSVLHSIAKGNGEVVQFANQAEFVAHFIALLLQGRAWDTWYLRSFFKYKQHSHEEVLQAVLLDNYSYATEVFCSLHRSKVLEKVLAELSKTTLVELWSGKVTSRQNIEAYRSLFMTAVKLLNSLNLFQLSNYNNLLQDYLTTKPPEPDWHDPKSLTEIVVDSLRFLYVKHSFTFSEEHLVELDTVLSEYDWLDIKLLKVGFLGLFYEDKSHEVLPTRQIRQGLTPKQSELFKDLKEALANVKLDATFPNSIANAVRWYSALLEQNPDWVDDATAKVVLERVLELWSITQSVFKKEDIESLSQSYLERIINNLPEEHKGKAEQALKAVQDPGIELLKQLAEITPDKTLITSQGAGVALLIRAILDLRLTALIKEVFAQSEEVLNSFLLTLYIRLAGADSVVDDEIDSGLCLLAGLSEPQRITDLQAWWSRELDNIEKFQAVWLNALVGQRMLKGCTMHLFFIEAESIKMLLASDETGVLWPLGKVINSSADVKSTIKNWLQLWQDATGYKPSVVISQKTLTININYSEVTLVDIEANDGLSKAHKEGLAALQEALKALQFTKLTLPEVDLLTFLVATSLLRLWSRWLKGFADSSSPYMLENFIRRCGQIKTDKDHLLVELEPKPFDVVTQMAGYLETIEHVPWLGKSIRFCV